MSEEKISEVGEPIEQSSDPETETPLKTPKKKFVMTPARLENLRKGREKRAENVRKKKEVEAQLKEEEKTKKAEIKKRVEAELSRRDNARVSDTVEFAKQTPSLREVEMQKQEEETSEPSDSEIAPPPPPKPIKPRKARTTKQNKSPKVQRVATSNEPLHHHPTHTVVFI